MPCFESAAFIAAADSIEMDAYSLFWALKFLLRPMCNPSRMLWWDDACSAVLPAPHNSKELFCAVTQDPNNKVALFESADIIKYLEENYAA